MSMHTFVVSSPVAASTARCKTVLGYDNAMTRSTVTASTATDANYPIELMYDYKTNTEYSPSATSGSVVITITQSEQNYISYFGLFSKNGNDCGLSFVFEVQDATTGTYTNVGSRGSFANAGPQMIAFDPILSVTQRVTINFTSKCYIAAMATGTAIVFPRTVSNGYQAGRNVSLDEVAQFSTDGNNFVQGRRIKGSDQERASINFLNYSWVDSWWRFFKNHALDSKTLFFMANDNVQTRCIFGVQVPAQLTKLNNKSSVLCDVDFEINGWAS